MPKKKERKKEDNRESEEERGIWDVTTMDPTAKAEVIVRDSYLYF